MRTSTPSCAIPTRPRPWLLLGLAALATACDSSPEGRVPVHPTTGRVLLRGKPLPGALVVFHAAEARPDVPRPTGTTDDDGNFALQTYGLTDGAPAGTYAVAVTVTGDPEPAFDPFRNAAEKVKVARTRMPNRRYADPATSGLTAAVAEGENQLPPFDLE